MTEPKPLLSVQRYAVYDEIAAGGMATVHFARLLGAHGFRRTVAIKRLLPHLTRNQDFVLMLVDEARLAARISHPNVVTTLDVVQTASEVLLVMEYVHGESLAKLARWANAQGQRIPLPIACAIVADALHGLHAAHEARDERGAALGLVHRDVSPQNLLVGLDGIPRIADFGVAKAAGRSQTTRDGIVKGKLAYMAPEQLSSGETSPASDVFAAAVVLWETLTGQRLFAGKNHAETAFKVLSAPLPAASSCDSAIPTALDDLLMRGLARDPAQRFASAREMALAVERCAPSVRPSDLSRWVEQVVGDKLDARLSLLRAIERSGDEDASEARTRVRPTPNAAAGITRSRARYVAWAALLALIATVTTAMLRRPSSASYAGAVRPIPTRPASPPSAAIAPMAPLAASPSAAVSSPLTAVSQSSGVDATAVRERAPVKSRMRTARTPDKAREKAPDCNPPFTIDREGHRVFKTACL